MSTISRFEELPVWQTARKLARMIFNITNRGKFSKDYALRDQIRRASISVMSNIAEGFEHETQAQFITYLGRAKGSAGEIRCQLYISLDLEYISKEEFKEINQLSLECSKQLYGFIKYLRSLPNTRRSEYSKESQTE
jgi:four helix bundle protein